jgi:cysteine desulfurase
MIYLDNNATTKVDPRVAVEMMSLLSDNPGNPSSIHAIGRSAKNALDAARAGLASFLSADPNEIVFTSGGTESDNTAILGSLSYDGSDHIVTTRVEHEAVRNVCAALENKGTDVTWLDVASDGSLDLDDLRRALKPETRLVSVMLANNETGVLFPVREIAAIAKEHSNALMHVDAVNAAGKIPIVLAGSDIDLLSISGHKFHGPKGVGVLYVRGGTRLNPMAIGGGQESGRRAGTEAVHQVVGLARAAELASESMPLGEVRDLRNRLEKGILHSIPDCYLNGTDDENLRLPNTTNISFENVNGELLLSLLDDLGVCVSTGSACNAGGHGASPVLTAMNIPFSRIMGSIRFSLSRFNTESEIDFVLDNIGRLVARLRAMSAS